MTTFNLTTEINQALRQLHRKWPSKKEAMNEAIHPTEKGPRGGNMFICAQCGLCFNAKDIQMDHIQPVVPVHETIHTMKWNHVIERLFSPKEAYQCLCKPCHQVKCNAERLERMEYRAVKSY